MLILDDMMRIPAPGTWRPADWWTFVAMAEGSDEDRLELIDAASPRAQLAWSAHHRVEEVVSSGGPVAALVILALVDSAAPPETFDAVASGPLAALIRRHGNDLVTDLRSLSAGESAMLGGGEAWLDATGLEPSVKQRLARWLRGA
jgi:hypothetical protein